MGGCQKGGQCPLESVHTSNHLISGFTLYLRARTWHKEHLGRLQVLIPFETHWKQVMERDLLHAWQQCFSPMGSVRTSSGMTPLGRKGSSSLDFPCSQ